ncbi:23S rRNA (pseudouridine1915-N3)-methyltransferase [Humitalea rosea]|uniref:Ribosomal RNA large subunit methyltransferase H n=1 Tax=Humitalea rosea TaxID=990373 RepID=A0A2W7I6I4_9PROT|nr:23S rRNA (pseudouridine(1915)-N(3))-methyltransferase RlmH [Humitalea rosea]PZW41859.1 23S rRNA (pseudouridine1915-N3)-methyltransferase [Humitalea rosea]
MPLQRNKATKPRLLLAVGRLRSGPEAALYAEMAGRLRPALSLREIPEAKGSAAEVRRREGAALLAALPEGALAVALDLGGGAPDSTRFAAMTEGWDACGRSIAFLIGGAEGLDPAVLARADQSLSLGPLTWPHFWVRAMLAEQLFRAQCIRSGHPYHRAWRP